jgi:hypothetical protein
LLLPIDVGEWLEDVILGIPVFGVNTSGKLHVHVHLDGGLWIGYNKVDLAKGPIE